MSDIPAKFRDPRYRDIDRESFIEFLESFGFTAVAEAELNTFFSNGIITVQVPNEVIIQRLYILWTQQYLEGSRISEDEFLNRLDQFRRV